VGIRDFLRGNAFLGRYGKGVLVALCAFAVYAGTLTHELVWDDHILLAKARTTGFPALLHEEFPKEGSGCYHPLVLASLWLDDRLAGFFPPAYHLTNVLLHAGNSFLVHRLLAALFLPSVALWGARPGSPTAGPAFWGSCGSAAFSCRSPGSSGSSGR
jgi:hypothetical protein